MTCRAIFNSRAWYATFEYDTLDSIASPVKAIAGSCGICALHRPMKKSVEKHLRAMWSIRPLTLKKDVKMHRVELEYLGALSIGTNSFSTRFEAGFIRHDRMFSHPYENFSVYKFYLGGFFKFIGLHRDVISGEEMIFGSISYRHTLSPEFLGMVDMSLYLGLSFGAGNTWDSYIKVPDTDNINCT